MLRKFRKRLSNTTLKRKILFLMVCLATITPTILVSLFILAYYYLGIDSLFSQKISKSVAETVKIAELYLKEHKESIKGDILSVANDIDRNSAILSENPEWFTAFISGQAQIRGLSEAMIFTRNRVIAKSNLSFSLIFEKLPEIALQNAEKGEVVILSNELEDRVRAIMKLENFIEPTYLLVGRYVDREIINNLKETKGSAKQYKSLIDEIHSTRIELTFAFITLFILFSILSIIIAVKLSKLITRPINRLVNATQEIKSGNFSIRVPEKDARDETAILAKAFNNMTEKIEKQHNELVHLNRISDERRVFIETVLSEISAGVLVTNSEGIIVLYNNSAYDLLKKRGSTLESQPKIDELFPEVLNLLEKVATTLNNTIQSENLKITRRGKSLHLLVKASVILNKNKKLDSFIVTFDDISELISAQRSSAWADIARRIAHEIKNPLTPIQLAAERIKKKYGNDLKEDSNFYKYTDTIIRHVGEIERIIEDFVRFAKIPQPKISRNEINCIIEEAIFSQQNIFKHVKYLFDCKEKNCYVQCDKIQIAQVLTNLLKNAAESIEAKRQLLSSAISEKTDNSGYKKQISVKVKKEKRDFLGIEIEDNGLGITSEIMERISEPYVTTKQKGTGLGISIVKKIVEDHGGHFSIKNINRGASAYFTLKLDSEKTDE